MSGKIDTPFGAIKFVVDESCPRDRMFLVQPDAVIRMRHCNRHR